MAERKQLAATLAASAVALISLCAAGGLVWWYMWQSGAPPVASGATQASINTATADDAQVADINEKLNSLQNWTRWKGSWQELHPGLRGEGESDAEFDPDLPGHVRIAFSMNVVEGMRPRVFLGGLGVYFGNEGYTMQLSIFGQGVQNLRGNPIAYKNGQLMHITITIDHGSFTVFVDNNVITCRCYPCDRVRLRLDGGDNWSRGTTEFGNIHVETINGH
jgi:hypothetical protein